MADSSRLRSLSAPGAHKRKMKVTGHCAAYAALAHLVAGLCLLPVMFTILSVTPEIEPVRFEVVLLGLAVVLLRGCQ